MPTISRFYGISIKMFFEDHNPPHFHAVHGDHIGWFNIRTLELIKGDLPPRAIRLVKEWATEHQDELLAIWEKHEFNTIPGLDA
jgi:hypothetical protein